MFELAETTKRQLSKSLAAADKPAHRGKCFRVVPKDDKLLSLTLAKPAPSDRVIEHRGKTIFALPKALEPFFDNRRLEIDASGKFVLNEISDD